MINFHHNCSFKILAKENSATAAEYAIIVALIAIIIFATVYVIGPIVAQFFDPIIQLFAGN